MADINFPYPEAVDIELKIRLGACRLSIKPGEEEPWVSGTYDDPTGQIPTKIVENGGTITLTQGRDIKDILRLFGGVRKYELALGRGRPFHLALETGASENDLELGGIPIKHLEVKHGAGKNRIDFSSPNPFGMELFELSSGAGVTEVMNLANAGIGEMRVEGGAAAYKFDFGGTLTRNASVRINTGVSSVDIVIPSHTPAKVNVESVLGSLDVGDGFTKKAGAFWTEAAVVGNSPELNIRITVALGALKMRTR